MIMIMATRTTTTNTSTTLTTLMIITRMTMHTAIRTIMDTVTAIITMRRRTTGAMASASG